MSDTPQNVQYMRDASDAIMSKVPDNSGFILFVVPLGNTTGESRLRYSSNLDRQKAIALVKEWLFRNNASEDWMKHVQ